MKIYITLFLITFLCLETFAQSKEDSAAVNQAVTSFFNSWNNHDFKNIDSYATSDFTYINPPGSFYKNRGEVQKFLQSVHETSFKSTPLKEESRVVRFIAPNAAIVAITDSMGPATTRPTGERQIRTFVVVKQNQKWMLTASHGTAITPTTSANAANPTKQ